MSDEGGYYSITISESGVYVEYSIDTPKAFSAEAEIVEFDAYEGYTLRINGEIYYLMNAEYTDEVNKIVFMTEDWKTVWVTLSRM